MDSVDITDNTYNNENENSNNKEENEPVANMTLEAETPEKSKEININKTRQKLIPPEGLSKKAYKRLLQKQQREETRTEWKAKKKEKMKLAKARKREAIAAGLIVRPSSSAITQLPKKRFELEQIPSKMHIIIDLDFDEYMIDKEITSLSTQIMRCYSINRQSKHPVEVHLTSNTKRIQTRFDQVMPDSKKWAKMNFTPSDYLHLFPKDQLVYLTADSNHTLHHLDESKVYIVGGIVDKNRHKGLTEKKALSQGISTARLPIDDHIKMSQRKVLTVNHVFEILLSYLDCHDWKLAFLNAIPTRRFDPPPLSTASISDIPASENHNQQPKNSLGNDTSNEAS